MMNKRVPIKILKSKPPYAIFAHSLSPYKLFWVFFIGSFAGVLIETIWCLISAHKLEIRWGVVYGPLNPVYGFGAAIMTVILCRLSFLRDLWIFLICMVIGGAFEFLCSFIQEKVLNTVSWDYSNTEINFGGRTNLLFSFCWGILGLIWLKDIYPKLSSLIEKIPKKLGIISTWILAIFMALNMGISGLAIWRQGQRNAGISADNAFLEFLDNTYTDEFLKKIYPNMIFK